jgi:hypothetical protein
MIWLTLRGQASGVLKLPCFQHGVAAPLRPGPATDRLAAARLEFGLYSGEIKGETNVSVGSGYRSRGQGMPADREAAERHVSSIRGRDAG